MIENPVLKVDFWYIIDWNMFENSIFKTKFLIICGVIKQNQSEVGQIQF